MGTPTTTFSFDKPTVGGDDNAWGTSLNATLDKLDDLLDGTIGITPNLLTGWEVGGVAVTSTAAELNVLDGITATVTELNYVDGVTSAIQTQLDGKQALDADLTAIAGLASNGMIARTGAGTAAVRTITGTTDQIAVTNGDGVSGNPTIAAVVASQAEAQAGTDNTKLMTPLRVAEAVAALAPSPNTVLLGTINTTSGTTQTLTSLDLTPYKSLLIAVNGVSTVASVSGTRTFTIAGCTVFTVSAPTLVALRGLCIIDLASSVGTSSIADASGAAPSATTATSLVLRTSLTTASTSISVTADLTFDAGSVLVYGAK
jgi:hypothetical protein